MAYFYSPYRKKYSKKQSDICAFCDPKIIKRQTVRNSDNVMAENNYYRWMVNFFPKFEGHTLIVPKRHMTELGMEKRKEILAREKIINLASTVLRRLYKSSGLEIFLQTGTGSESSIQHLHWHVVPAMPDDRLRSFEKLGHFYTAEPNEERILIFPIRIKRSPSVLKLALARTMKKGAGQQC